MEELRIEDGTMTAGEDICVMGDEPFPDGTAEDVRAWYHAHPGEAGLAKALAIADNEFAWLALDEGDYELGTPEFEAFSRTVGAWGKLSAELCMAVLSIQRLRHDRIPKKGYLPILARFMERNGYRDSWGWWVPRKAE